MGKNLDVNKPWNIDVYGNNISIGENVHIRTSKNLITQLCSWNKNNCDGVIQIGDNVLISPGVRIISAKEIIIKSNVMIASNVYISDSDWHGIYDRAWPVGKSLEVVLEDNVWIGDRAIVNKGVRIGKNSIVGAGSVVVKDVPPNVVVAGNPAQVVKELDENEKMISRADMFSSPKELDDLYLKIDQISLKNNSFFGWIKSKLLPNKNN